MSSDVHKGMEMCLFCTCMTAKYDSIMYVMDSETAVLPYKHTRASTYVIKGFNSGTMHIDELQ